MKSFILRERYYCGVLLAGFLLDLAWVLLVPTQPFSDFLYYHQLARQIAAGGIWGDTYTAVGYPVFLAFFYRLGGAEIMVAKSVNLVLSVLNSLLVWRLWKILPLPEWSRRLAFLAFVLFPTNIYYNSVVGTEILFTCLLLLSLNVYFSRIRCRYVLTGLLIGLDSLVKPFFPAFLLVIVLMEFLSRPAKAAALKKCGTVLLAFLLVLTPWLYRNYKLIGEFTYISNNGGIVLYINNNSQNTSGGWMPAADVENSPVNTPAYQNANPTQKNKMLSQAAKQWIVTHPAEFLVLGFKRLSRTYLHFLGDIDYSLYGTGLTLETNRFLAAAASGIWLAVFLPGLLSILGFCLYYLRKAAGGKLVNLPQAGKEIGLLSTFVLFTGIYFVTEGQTRYAFPLIFILIYFSCRALAAGQDFLKQKQQR